MVQTGRMILLLQQMYSYNSQMLTEPHLARPSLGPGIHGMFACMEHKYIICNNVLQMLHVTTVCNVHEFIDTW
jgi:hypothetical protein